jgi:hypothetical protein
MAGSLGDILELILGRDREQFGTRAGKSDGKSEVFRALFRGKRRPLGHHQATDMGVAHGKRQGVPLQRLSGQVAISDQGAALGKAIKDGRTDRAADRIEADKEATRRRGALELVKSVRVGARKNSYIGEEL